MNDELFPPYPPKEIRHEHPAEKVQEIFGIMAALGWGMPQKSLGKALAEELEGGFEPDEQESKDE
jgi:hypothetical protein